MYRMMPVNSSFFVFCGEQPTESRARAARLPTCKSRHQIVKDGMTTFVWSSALTAGPELHAPVACLAARLARVERLTEGML